MDGDGDGGWIVGIIGFVTALITAISAALVVRAKSKRLADQNQALTEEKATRIRSDAEQIVADAEEEGNEKVRAAIARHRIDAGGDGPGLLARLLKRNRSNGPAEPQPAATDDRSAADDA